MSTFLATAKEIIRIESQEISRLESKLDENFNCAVQAILESEGSVVVTGLGKSGLIGRKIAATLSSTGTPSFFMHPTEAFHGDLGMIKQSDIVLLISYSGATDDILKILPFLQHQKNTLIAMTGFPDSSLARNVDHHLNVHVACEACPYQLAPTSSTTAALVMGDALALTVMKFRNFQPEDFACFHPGGSLGRKLLTRVKHEMIPLPSLPLVARHTPAMDVFYAISRGKLGMVVVVESGNKIVGVITDGDIRRAVLKHKEALFHLTAKELMSTNPRTISPEKKVVEAEAVMDQMGIHQLLVANDSGCLLGVLPYRSQIKKS